MNHLMIRICTYEDLDAVLALQEKWKNEDTTYGFVPAGKRYLEEKLGNYFYLAELNSEIIGFIYGSLHVSNNITVFDNGQTYIEVEDLYIVHKYRDASYGSQLIDQLLRVAHENGVDRSLVYSSTKDIESVLKFYKKHEYKSWCIQLYK